jgi:PRTRC genetic system protein B
VYCDAEYGRSVPMHLLHGILLYGSENKIRLATIHQPVNDPQGGPPMLDAGEPLTREFLEYLVRGLGSELPACFLPAHVLVYSASFVAWWEPAQRRAMFFASDCDGKSLDRRVYPHPPLVFAVRSRRLMVWALAENRRPEPDSLVYLAPYWNVYGDGVCATDRCRRQKRFRSRTSRTGRTHSSRAASPDRTSEPNNARTRKVSSGCGVR